MEENSINNEVNKKIERANEMERQLLNYRSLLKTEKEIRQFLSRGDKKVILTFVDERSGDSITCNYEYIVNALLDKLSIMNPRTIEELECGLNL